MNWKRVLGCILALGIARIILTPTTFTGTCLGTPKCHLTLQQLCRSVFHAASRIDPSAALMIGTALALCMCFATGVFGLIWNCTKNVCGYLAGPREVASTSDTGLQRRPSRSLDTPSSNRPEDDVPSSVPKQRREPNKKDVTFAMEGSAEGSTIGRRTRSRSTKASTPASSRGSKSSQSISSSSRSSRTSVTTKTKAELEFVKPGCSKSTTTMSEPRRELRARRTRSEVGMEQIPSSSNVTSEQSGGSSRATSTSARRRSVAHAPATSDSVTIIMPPPPPPSAVTSGYFLRKRNPQPSIPPRRQRVRVTSTPDSSSQEERISHGSAHGPKAKKD